MNASRTLFPSIFLLILMPLALSAVDRRQSAALLKQAETQDDLAAMRTLRRALKADPGNIAARYRLGFIYQKMNRKKKAGKIYGEVLKRSPCHARTLNNLGGVELDLGRAARAESYYRRAIRCDRRFFLPHYNLANILRDRGEFQEAAAAYHRALRRKPDHARSHHNLGIVHYHLAGRGGPAAVEQGRLARRHLKRAIELQPKDALQRFNYARVLAGGGHRELALRELQTAERYSRRKPGLRARIREEYQKLKYAKG